jgi:hypothetical protein
MKNLTVFWATITVCISTLILPSKAISQATIQPCELALFNSKKNIEQERDITVTMDITDGSESYPDYPDGRPIIIVIYLNFPGSYGYRGSGNGSADDAVLV